MSVPSPSPWRWWPCKDGSYSPMNDYAQIASGDQHVAQVRIASVSEADMRLIAAAPDLLDELQNIANANPREWDESTRDQFQQWAQNRARAAIAKATGEQS